MHGEAMKYKHVAGVDLAADPIPFCHCCSWNLRDVQILVFMADDTGTLRALQYLQGAQVGWTIVKRNPSRKALDISAHEAVILMRMDRETLAIWEDQSPDWLGVNQDLPAHHHVHHIPQRRMMRQRME